MAVVSMRSLIFLICFASFMVKQSSFSQPDGISMTLLEEDFAIVVCFKISRENYVYDSVTGMWSVEMSRYSRALSLFQE